MRSDLMKKGVERAPHRSLFKAMGYTDEEIARPLIGVVNSYNEIIPGHIHLRTITEQVKAGIRMAGGTPVEFPAIGVCDGIAMGHVGMKYSLASRELVADSVEIMAIAHPFDGLVFIPNCDKVVPGMLMAALRLNIPSIFISGGPMLAGKLRGKPVDLITVFEGVGAVKSGKMTARHLKELEDCACPGCGSCSGMYTANTMNCMTEALGMGLPGNGTVLAVDSARLRLAKTAGMQVMELVKKKHPAPRHRNACGLQERHRRGQCPGRLDEHRASPAGHRPRGGHPARPGSLQPDRREDPQPLQAEPRRGPPHRGPRGGRRRPGRDEGDQQARRDR